MIAYKTRPSDPHSWHSLVAKASRFKPSEVDQNSIMGSCIVDGFYRSPVDTIEMIMSQAADNAQMVQKVIGDFNFKILSV